MRGRIRERVRVAKAIERQPRQTSAYLRRRLPSAAELSQSSGKAKEKMMDHISVGSLCHEARRPFLGRRL